MTRQSVGRTAAQHAGRLGVAAFGIVLAFALTALGVHLLALQSPDIGTVPPTTPAPTTVSPEPIGHPKRAVPAPAPVNSRAPFSPARLRVPQIGVNAPVVPVTVQADGQLAVPGDVRTVGWWSAGAASAAPSGTVVLVGHVDSARQGRGAFFAARELRPGGRVVLGASDGRITTYVVAARRQYPKKALPVREVFGQGRSHRLVLVTCGGTFDEATGHYSDNLVVYAVPAVS